MISVISGPIWAFSVNRNDMHSYMVSSEQFEVNEARSPATRASIPAGSEDENRMPQHKDRENGVNQDEMT